MTAVQNITMNGTYLYLHQIHPHPKSTRGGGGNTQTVTPRTSGSKVSLLSPWHLIKMSKLTTRPCTNILHLIKILRLCQCLQVAHCSEATGRSSTVHTAAAVSSLIPSTTPIAPVFGKESRATAGYCNNNKFCLPADLTRWATPPALESSVGQTRSWPLGLFW